MSSIGKFYVEKVVVRIKTSFQTAFSLICLWLLNSGVYIRWRPPYSPFLNIVEQAISSLKAAIKADLSRPAEQESMNNREEVRRQGISPWRISSEAACWMLRASQRNMNSITQQKCAQWYRFMQTYIPRCLKRPNRMLFEHVIECLLK